MELFTTLVLFGVALFVAFPLIFYTSFIIIVWPILILFYYSVVYVNSETKSQQLCGQKHMKPLKTMNIGTLPGVTISNILVVQQNDLGSDVNTQR